MRQCFGRTKTFRRCGRVGPWKFFCKDHLFQPVLVLIALVGWFADIGSIYAFFTQKAPPTVDCSKPIAMTISSGIIQIPHVGCYALSPDSESAEGYVDEIKCRAGDRFALRAADGDRTIALRSSSARMPAQFHLNCENDRIRFACGSDGVAEEESRQSNCD